MLMNTCRLEHIMCICIHTLLQNSALNGVMAKGVPGLKDFSLANVCAT